MRMMCKGKHVYKDADPVDTRSEEEYDADMAAVAPDAAIDSPLPHSPPQFVIATVNYFVEPKDGAIAYQCSDMDPVTGDRKRNFTRRDYQIPIHNLRGREDSVTLDTAGFQLLYSPAKHTSFATDEEIEKEYYPESIALIKEVTGAARVVLFDHTIRRRRPGQIDDGPQKRQPVMQVHVDQTAASAAARVRRHLPADEAPGLLQGRFQVLNLWRPIHHTADDHPLALCDYRSVDAQNDPAIMKVIYPNFQGETLGIKYNSSHRWGYFAGMTTEEALLFKCFDSAPDVAVFAPHCAFKDPTTPAGSPLRESIELRALVFYD